MAFGMKTESDAEYKFVDNKIKLREKKTITKYFNTKIYDRFSFSCFISPLVFFASFSHENFNYSNLRNELKIINKSSC